MADQEVIKELLTKFTADVDEQSYAKAKRVSQNTLADISVFNKENRKNNLQGLQASIDAELGLMGKRHKAEQAQLKIYYKERLELAKKNKEDITGIEQEMSQQMQMLSQKQTKEISMFNKEDVKEVSNQFTGIFGSIKGIAGAVGAGGLVGMFGVAGLVKGLKDANDQLRGMQFAARRIQFASGSVSPTFGAEFLHQARGIRRKTGMSVEEISGIGMGFAREGIVDFDEQGSEMMGGLARNAIGLGAGYAVDPSGVVESQRRMARLGTSPSNLDKEFNRLAQSAQRAKAPVDEWVNSVVTMTEQGRMYNVTLTESNNLMRTFAKELREGKVTQENLNRLQRGMAGIGTGTQAFYAQGLSGSSALSEELRKMFANVEGNDIASAMLFRQISEGGFDTEETHGANRGSLMRAVGQKAIGMAKGFMPEGLGGEEARLMERFFIMNELKRSGMITGGETLEYQEMAEKVARGEAKPQTLRGITPRTPEQAIDQGMDSLQKSMSIWEQVGLDLELLFTQFIMSTSILFERYFGDRSYKDMANDPNSRLYMASRKLASYESKGYEKLEDWEKEDYNMLISLPGATEALGEISPEYRKRVERRIQMERAIELEKFKFKLQNPDKKYNDDLLSFGFDEIKEKGGGISVAIENNIADASGDTIRKNRIDNILENDQDIIDNRVYIG